MVQALGPGDPEAVGRYRLVGRLGQGGMGQVYLGESPGGRLVAVKVIRPELAGDSEFRARFTREVATARTVSGIYTVPVVDADVDGPQPWLATAFVEGPSLADRVNNFGPLTPAAVLTMAAGLAEGLEVIHAVGVVHRDLKPSNVLLAQDGPRIIDFGISQAAGLPGVTRTGVVTGSPGYMSPEQAEGGVAGAASDVFSLGSVLAFAATGREPFGPGSPPSVLYRVVHMQPDTDGIREPLRSLVARCLAKDPAWRPTAGQIVAELGAARPGVTPREPDGPGTKTQAPWNARVPGEPAPRPTQAYQPTVTSMGGDPVGASGRAGLSPSAGPGTWLTASTGPPTLRQPGAGQVRPGRRARGLTWAGVAAAAIAIAGGLIFFALPHHAAHTNTVANTGTYASASSSGSASSQGAGTRDWVRYTDPSGFSIKIPPGWSVTSTGTGEVRFTGPLPGYVILVAWTNHPQADAYADWERQAAAKAASDRTYQQISIQRVDYRGWNAADWEFINFSGGEKTHVLDRGFVVIPGALGYAIEISGPANDFAAARAALWNGLTATFEPAS